MGIANRIINALVLVAAIVAVVLGIMLFNKREDVAQGREMMAKAIADNTAKMIAEEDSKNVRKLTVKTEDMAIEKTADDIRLPLKKFDDAAKKIVQQRDTLAKYAVELTSIISENQGMEAFSATRLADYSMNPDESAKITGRVNERVEANKQVRTAFVSAVQGLNAKMKMDELDAAKANAGNPDVAYLTGRVEAIADKANAQLEKSEVLTQHAKAISSIMEFDEPALDGADYASVLQSQRAAFEKKMQDFNDLVSAKDTLTTQVKETKTQLDTATTEVEEVKKLLAIREKELAAEKNETKRLKQIISPAAAKQQTGSGSLALNTNYTQLKKVQAKVIYTNPKLSFVVIDLGKKTQVELKNADGSVAKSDIQLPPNAVMTVATSLDPKAAHFNGKIQLASIGDNETIANILPTPGTEMPKVGDVVYFSNYDLESVRQANEKRLQEMRAQIAQPAGAEDTKEDDMDDLLGSGDDAKAESSEETAEEESADDDVL